MTKRVLLCDPILNEGIALLEQEGYQVTKAWNLPKSELLKIINEYNALIVRSATKVDAELISKATKLQVIGRAGDGLDNVDQEQAKKQGIEVVNTPHVSSTSVAELAIGHLLSLARDIVESTISLREGKWIKEESMGTEVKDKTLGIIGCGSIGREVKKLAMCLGMNVITVDICVSEEFVPLDKMLPQADFISINVPLTPHTRHLISTKEFNKMKTGVRLINCSRGGIVDEEALYNALVEGKVKGAALDVFEQEPPKNNKLLALKNVYATPHIGAQTWEGQLRTSKQIAMKVIEALKDEWKVMVDIKPFQAIRYTAKAGTLKNLITQPYDKINQDMQREYYEKSPYNYCRLILPLEQNRYETVHQRLYEWLNEHIIAKDEEPAVFICRQDFRLDGRNCSRTGVIAAIRLYAYGEGMVFPHETTYAAPKADRLNMLRNIQKDLEPVFLIYSDPEKTTLNIFAEIVKSPPTMEVEDEFRVVHKVWRVTDPENIALLQDALEPKKLVITDGHHRYESALEYRDERRKQVGWTKNSAFNFHMSYIVPVQDEGLVILPTHRLLRKFELTIETLEALASFFEISELEPQVTTIECFLRENKAEHAFCIYDGVKAYGLLLRDDSKISKLADQKVSSIVSLLDVVILKDVVFKIMMKTGELRIDEDIVYERSMRVAMEKIENGEAKLAFLVNPINPELVWEVAQKHERLPEKSTDFYPKPASGLTMMDISTEEKL